MSFVLNKNKILKICIFCIPIFFIIFTAPHSILFEEFDFTYYEFTTEDGIIEYLTSLFYLSSFILSILISRIFFKNHYKIFGISYVILGIIFLIGGFEEISWGQRILGVDTPDIFSSNRQNESNIHNLDVFPHDFTLGLLLLVGFFGLFAWMFLPTKKNSTYNIFVRYFVPKWYVTVFFIPPFLTGIDFLFVFFDLWELRTFVISNILLFHTTEFFEFSLSAGVLLFVLSVFVRLRINYHK